MASSTPSGSPAQSTSSSPRRRSSSDRPSTRPRRSRRTRTQNASSGSATRTSARRAGEASAQSARRAGVVGAYDNYPKNQAGHDRVMEMHRLHAYRIRDEIVPSDLLGAARQAWDDAVAVGTVNGFRNAQASVLAPTGTISFMMDCDTTGVEPDIALVKYKRLVGGGMLKIVNQTVPSALSKLGYTESQVAAITEYIEATGTIES